MRMSTKARLAAGVMKPKNQRKGIDIMWTYTLAGLTAIAMATTSFAPMAWAGEWTCADYDKADVYSSCELSANCCAGLASFKAVCDLYHARAESHIDASNMLKSKRDIHEWNKDYKACLRGR
jgi:hypothetical protein